MKLTGQQFKQFHNALIDAFSTQGILAQMVSFELNENLDAIAGGQNHSEVVFNLIQWARSQGKLEQLMTAAINSNPGNPELQAFVAQFQPLGSPTSSPSNAQTAIAETIDRILAGHSTEADLQILLSALRSGQVVLSSGERSVSIGGSTKDSVVITGNNNQIITVSGGDAETLKQILRDLEGNQ